MAGSPPLNTNVNRGLAWVGIASSLVGVLDFAAILIILGFWIPADQYGVATMAIWVFPVLDQITDLGLSAAVIQRGDHDEDTISTVFWINLATAALLFGLLLLFAPILARDLYGHDVVGYMLIAYGTKLLWQNVYFMPVALMKRELRFKELSIIRIIANLGEFVGKVGFAAAGFGIWCFVLGSLCRVLITGIGAQLRHPWRPRFVLRLRAARTYVSYGLKTSGSQILFSFYTNIDYPIVGYYFGDAALGIYRMAYEIVLEPVRVISFVVADIAFPTFAKLRTDRPRLVSQFLSFTRLNLVTVMVFSAIVFVGADDLLAVFFPKYQAATDAVRILCIVAVLRSVSFVMPPLLDGLGHPNRTLTYMIIAAIALPASFLIFANVLGDSLGFLSVAVAWAVGYPIAFVILLALGLATLQIPASTFLRAVGGIPICAVAAAVIGELAGLALAGQSVALRLAVTTGVIVLIAAVLLAYTQGLSLRTAFRSMRGDANAP